MHPSWVPTEGDAPACRARRDLCVRWRRSAPAEISLTKLDEKFTEILCFAPTLYLIRDCISVTNQKRCIRTHSKINRYISARARTHAHRVSLYLRCTSWIKKWAIAVQRYLVPKKSVRFFCRSLGNFKASSANSLSFVSHDVGAHVCVPGRRWLIADRQKLRSAKKVKLASDDCSGGKNFPRHLSSRI